MSKRTKNKESTIVDELKNLGIPDSFTCVSTFKFNYLGCMSFKFTIEHGQVVSVEPIHNGFDVSRISVGIATGELYKLTQTQQLEADSE